MRAARAANDGRTLTALHKIRKDILKEQFGDNAPEYERLQPPPVLLGFLPESLKTKLPKPDVLEKQIKV